jgi:hypothetical protein
MNEALIVLVQVKVVRSSVKLNEDESNLHLPKLGVAIAM